MSRSPQKLQKSIPGLWEIVRRFWPQIRKQGFLLAISVLALLTKTGLALLEPWPLKILFDQIMATGFNTKSLGIPFLNGLNPVSLITVLALAMVAIAGLRSGAAYFSTLGLSLAANRIIAEVRGILYTHLQRLSLSFHYKARSGDLMTRVIHDIERLRGVTVTGVVPLLTSILTLVGMLCIVFWLNLELALIAIAVFPLFVLYSLHATKRLKEVARKQRRREGAMAADAAEAFSAIKVVQALSLEDMLEKTFSIHNKKNLKEDALVEKLHSRQERVVEVLAAIATALVLWRGVQLVLRHVITPGDLLIFITYLKNAFKPIGQLARYTEQITKATASGERIIDILDIVPEIRDSRGALNAPPFRGAVRFENVTFAYEPEKNVFKNLNLEVQPGQQIALVGPSGGGKSTLISLLLRLYDPLEGRILIDGHDIREYKLDSLRRQISIVLQESVLFATSVRENIAYGSLGASEKKIEAAARLANAHDFIMALPDGYDTILGDRGATLSGGQRQRIAIARAAIRNAPILIWDEPTTGLDKENERAVIAALENLAQGRTTFIITHDLHLVAHADVILYLEGGRVVERGTHKELMQNNGCYAALYRIQLAIYPQNTNNEESIEHLCN
ncbi:protein tyrosine phosphatase [Scytonema hofmannii PCC 7110]|uniref:Protein tyrosine phosphatase n=1 Tax=Scytonema hofmannii PCC 7110 TaxID=128403 RepID=A0A139X9X5_9CYAN|nr:ABC transporter ATP-binding protein [Scytonema hofmannii]KYC41494.1 protein tyrosine phosphatase [Scytonema hofmannii PCC 7110]